MYIKALPVVVALFLLLSCEQESDTPSHEIPPDDGDAPTETPIDDEPAAEPDEDDFLQDGEGRIFSYVPVGDLLPSSGPGHDDTTIYRPDITFPLEDAAFLNSQVYRYGGSQGSVNGMSGGQCHETNYAYPWQDTFCETRSRDQIMCPAGGHEGVDIRQPHAFPILMPFIGPSPRRTGVS